MRRAWVIYNVRAGQPAFGPRVERAAEALARRGVSVRLERADDMAGLRRAAREAVAEGADAVFVAGGDGTLGSIASDLAGSPVALGCLPAGTGNVWSQTLRLPQPWPWRPRAIEQAALLQAESPARLTDLGRCNSRGFLAWAGVGLDAFVTAEFERRRAASRRGGYVRSAAVTFAVSCQWRGANLRLRVTGPAGEQTAAGRYLMVTVANIPLHGGGLFRLARDVRLDDGLLDAWAFTGDSYREMLAHAWRVQRGRHLNPPHPGVCRLTGHQIEIYTDSPQTFHLDAEPQPAVKQLFIEVVPRCLRVLVPRAAGRELYQGGA
jgi:diacylglycerol kinase (ATP)